MLNLRLTKGPLPAVQKARILTEYNRLALAGVSPQNFQRWIEGSPAGPALHAMLETDDQVIVGHCCLFPFPMEVPEGELVVAKAEYFFVSEPHRSERLRGFESSFKPPALILLEQLYRCGVEQGWSPLIISAPKQIEPLHKMAGCQPLSVALRECLAVLRPWRAALATPNLSPTQRVAIFLTGVVQRAFWFLLLPWFSQPARLEAVSVTSGAELPQRNGSSTLSFSKSDDFLAWRYPPKDYFRLAFGRDLQNFAILKRGSGDSYLRVCQSRLASRDSCFAMLVGLVKEARREKALGVRWAVYENGRPAEESPLVKQMRKVFFLCAPRVRNLWIYAQDDELRRPEKWNLSDSLFSFDN